ncbi:MAG: basic amino acid ABC transporter substrate-binding protein [Chloroflexota bacterium]|nr:MAG: basic amino acid ABC transporter substrate-binding protein [Chloroflexota bacterium]
MWFMALVWVALLLAACRGQEDAWQRVQETGVLKVGLDPTYPPFEAADANGVFGLDVDLANALAVDLGVQTEFVLFGYDGLYDALATGQVDVLISALVVAPERTKDFAYSTPYFNAGEILIVRQDEENIVRMEDLHGRTLAVELGALGHVEATSWAKRLPTLTIVPYQTADEALTAVTNHEADAALVDAISGRLFLRQTDGLKRTAVPITVEPFAIVTRIADRQLLEQINRSLTALENNGQLDEITQQWLGK